MLRTNVGGVPSLVKDGVTGLLVRSGDVNALSDAVSRLIKDPHLRQGMGREARSRVFPSYDVSELVERLDAFYSALSDKKQGF